MKGVVASARNPRAADVGAAILAKGGNAFDAAVATAFSQMVNDPFMCGIGGMGTLHYYRADEGRSGMVDFYNRAGSKVRRTCGSTTRRAAPRSRATACSTTTAARSATTSIMTPGTPAASASSTSAIAACLGRAAGARDRAGRRGHRGRHRTSPASGRAIGSPESPTAIRGSRRPTSARCVPAARRSLLRSRRSHAAARLRAHPRAHRARRLARVPPRPAR